MMAYRRMSTLPSLNTLTEEESLLKETGSSLLLPLV
jgi:hypothetical protein